MNEFPLRLLQLDLARQMETMQFIKDMIDLAARCGYTGIMLYLEDRVRTKSYPYPSPEESYSEEQIRELVAYGEQRKIELFPCVATLEHAERFLRHQELEHLAELQGDMKGRFGGSRKDSFCPTHPEFYHFIGSYLTEIAALFPSPYFHAGLDESWDFNLCPRCRKAAPDSLSEERLFLNHIKIIHGMLKKLGKRMMMWSDMFEHHTRIMPEVPSDVIMMDWQYQQDVRSYQGHLLDIEEEDRMATNEKYGFETIIAPADNRIGNVRSYIEYTENRKALGCIVTSWEKSDTFLYRSLPVFACAGFMMQGISEKEASQKMMEELFGTQDKALEETIKQVSNTGFWRHFSSFSENRLFTRNFFGLPYDQFQIDQLLITLLEEFLPRVNKELGRIVCRDMIFALREKVLSHRLKKLIHASLDRGLTASRKSAIEEIFGEVAILTKQLESEWECKRPGILPNVFSRAAVELRSSLEESLAKLEAKSFLRLRCCAPDEFIVQPITIFLLYDNEWHEIASGNYKANSTETALFERFIAFKPKAGTPSAIRFELAGIGGRGLCYAEVRLSDGRVLVPDTVLGLSGIVEHPEHILENDVNWAWFGKQSSRETYMTPELSTLKNTLTLTLKERKN